MRLNLKRPISYVIIALIYIFASVIGVITFNMLKFDLWLNLLIADVVATAVTFIFSLIFSNASVYDPYWSVQPLVITALLALSFKPTLMAIIMIVVVFIWGIRLTANWAYTFKGMAHQDWRYTMLNEKTGVFYPLINFLGIHLFPTLVVYACVLPVVYAITLGIKFNALSLSCAFVSIGAVILQLVSDCQMQAFRNNRTSNFITVGLWKYSRHPNYLGEILMWWGMALCFVCAKPDMWYLASGAVINTLMFLFVSIPMEDKRQAKKEGFSQYKSSTRMLLPIKK